MDTEKTFSLDEFVYKINCNLDQCKAVIELISEYLPVSDQTKPISGALYAVENILESSIALADQADGFISKNRK